MSLLAAYTSLLHFTFALRRGAPSLLHFTFALWRRACAWAYKKHSGRGDPSKLIDEKKGKSGREFLLDWLALLGSRRWLLVWAFLFLVASLVSVWLGFRFASLILSRSRVLGVPVLGSFFLFPSFLIIYYTDFQTQCNPFVKLI